MHANDDPFAGTDLSNADDKLLADVWDWCAIKGCRSVCLSGRLFVRNSAWDKFRWVTTLPAKRVRAEGIADPDMSS